MIPTRFPTLFLRKEEVSHPFCGLRVGTGRGKCAIFILDKYTREVGEVRRKGIALICLICVFCLAGCTGTVRTDAPMTSFSYAHSGMDSGSIYCWEAYMTQEGPKVHMWLLCGETEYTCPAAEVDYQALRDLIDQYDLWKWAGFDKTNRHVLDGEGFDLQIEFADGTRIEASGSNCFPAGYDDAVEAIRHIFEAYMKEGTNE